MIVLLFKFCEFKKEDNSTLDYNTNLIQQQIVNIGKLIVTVGILPKWLPVKVRINICWT